MLSLIVSYTGSPRAPPLAFASAAPQCRILTELVDGGFRTLHYSSQLLRRCDCQRVAATGRNVYVDDSVQRVHVVAVKRFDDDGGVPASLAAACWWFKKHPQFVPISLLVEATAMRSLARFRDIGFADRVELLCIGEANDTVPLDFLAPVASFVNLRKLQDHTNSSDARWMLACPQLAEVDLTCHTRPASWNIGDVLPQVPSLRALTLLWSTRSWLSWLPKVTQLTHVTVTDCSWLSDCSAFSGMLNLVSLKTSLGNLTDISALTNCTRLKHLSLGGGRRQGLTDASPIGKLLELQELHIEEAAITDISWIRSCTQLRKLSLSRVPLGEGAEVLAELPHLTCLELTAVSHFHFDWVTPGTRLEVVVAETVGPGGPVAGLHKLRNARMLKVLSVDTADDYSWVGDCVMLERIQLSCRADEWDLVDHLFSMPHLEELSLTLRGSGDTGDSDAVVCATDPVAAGRVFSLETVEVCGRNMSCRDALHVWNCIARCGSVRVLELYNVPVPEGNRQWLLPLASLRKLRISIGATPSIMNTVGTLTDLRELNVAQIDGWTGFTGAWKCAHLESIMIHNCNALHDLSALSAGPLMRQLTKLGLRNVAVKDLSFLKKAIGLRQLTLVQIPQLRNLEGLAYCPNLEGLEIGSCPELRSLTGLNHCFCVNKCDIGDCISLDCVDVLTNLVALRDVYLSGLPQLATLSLIGPVALDVITVRQCDRLVSLHLPANGSCHLRRFSAHDCPLLTINSVLANRAELVYLTVGNNDQVEVLPPLDGCPMLSCLHLLNLPRLRDVSSLLRCSVMLTRLSIMFCKSIVNIEVVSKLLNLKSFGLTGLHLTDLFWICGCTSLTSLSLSRCTGCTDYSCIVNLLNLEHLFIEACPLNDLSFISRMRTPPLGDAKVYDCPQFAGVDRATLPSYVQIE